MHDARPEAPAPMDRREFLAGATGGAMAASIMSAKTAFGSEANSVITLALFGCGGRGTWLADLFKEHGGYRFTAACDYFPARAERFAEKFEIPEAGRFTGLGGYRRLLEKAKPDAVVIESPPYFHPEQAAAAVDAGCHVYMAKPIAVDVPGCHTVAESAKEATRKNLVYLVDFQTRTHPFYQEAVKRVRYGEIGRVISAEAGYQAGPNGRRTRESGPEARLNNWMHDQALSGDIITEQNIHALDVACWMLGGPPSLAYGRGGLKVRDYGDTWEHFEVIYLFPDEVPLTFSSKQFGSGYDDIMCRVYGEMGSADTHYFGNVTIRGTLPFKGGSVGSLYRDGAVRNIATFHDNITRRLYQNDTVPESVTSNLTTILGRIAAYRNREVAWDEMLRENEKIDGRLEGLVV